MGTQNPQIGYLARIRLLDGRFPDSTALDVESTAGRAIKNANVAGASMWAVVRFPNIERCLTFRTRHHNHAGAKVGGDGFVDHRC